MILLSGLSEKGYSSAGTREIEPHILTFGGPDEAHTDNAKEFQPTSSAARKAAYPLSYSSRNAFSLALCVITVAAVTPAYQTTTVIDPANDNALAPDIVAISAGFTRTQLLLAAEFRPGTLHPANLSFNFGIDTDLDPTTGNPGGFPHGMEYSVFFNSLRSASVVEVQNTVTTELVATLPISFSQNSVSISVPLSVLGGDDGIANFAFGTGEPIDAYSSFASDQAPDWLNGELKWAGPTTPVPEPVTFLWLLVSLLLAALAGFRRMLPRVQEQFGLMIAD